MDVINTFKDFVVSWITLCPKPIGNTITLNEIDKIFKNKLLEELPENSFKKENEYIVIHFSWNTIKIKDND